MSWHWMQSSEQASVNKLQRTIDYTFYNIYYIVLQLFFIPLSPLVDFILFKDHGYYLIYFPQHLEP